MDDVILAIGTEKVVVPPVSFAALEAAWQTICAFRTAPDLIAQAGLVVTILAKVFADTRPDLTEEVIKKRLTGRQFVDLVGQVPAIFKFMGLVPEGETRLGEATPAAGSSDAPASGS